jgi:UPF0755 protein
MITRKKNYLMALFLLLFVVGGFLWYQSSRYQYLISTAVDPTDSTNISFVIKKGTVLNDIAANLKENNLILDEGAFKQYLKNGGIDRNIVAGRFLLNKTQTIPEIAGILSDASKSQFILTVQEGSTIREIDEKLVALDIIKSGEFITAVNDFNEYEKYPFLDKEKISSLPHQLEGYLFPDTYFLDPMNFHSEDLIQLMLTNFKNRLGDKLSVTGDRSLHEIITMASIVEKEVRTDKDLPIVAGVLWKRLDSGWLLGADATLLYLKNDREIDSEDLTEDSPYNTRVNLGLPPGPINNPGLKSIMAAMNPEESDYFFYLTKPGSGEVVYAVTNDEHNSNKARYLY